MTGNVYPATRNQASLLLHQRMFPKGAAYNCAFTARICSSVDPSLLEKAFRGVLVANPALLSQFNDHLDWPAVQAADPGLFKLEHHKDLSLDALQQAVEEAYERPFDLEKGLPLRLHLLSKSDTHHLLVFCFHHVIADASSVGLLLRQLKEHLEFLGGLSEKKPRESKGGTVEDFARGQEAYLKSPQYHEDMAFWENYLTGDLPLLDLNTDFPRPPLRNDVGAVVKMPLSEALVSRLRALAQELKTSFNSIMLTAYAELIHYHSQQRDVIIGMPYAGRMDRRWMETLGNLVNPLPIRFQKEGDPSLAALIHQTSEQTRMLGSHAAMPLQNLQEAFGQTLPNRTPLFQTMFNISPLRGFGKLMGLFTPSEMGRARQRVSWAGLVLEPYYIDQQLGQFELGMEVLDLGRQQVCLALKYASDLFNAGSMETLVRRYVRFLENLVEAPHSRRSEVVWLDKSEWHLLLETWNHTAQELGDHFLNTFTSQARLEPERLALTQDGLSLTYGALHRWSLQLASTLRKQGIGYGDLVGVCCPREPAMVVAALATMMAGAAYVPLDPDYPKQRLLHIAGDAALACVLCTQKTQALASELGQPVQVGQPHRDREADEFAAVHGEQIAYAIYTSGSTGKPKGVAVTHENLANLLADFRQRLDLSGEDRLLAVTSLSFDIAGLELFLPLTVGAQVFLAPTEVTNDGPALKLWLKRNRISVMQATPTTWRLLIEDGFAAPELTALCGGEAMPSDLKEPLSEAVGSLYNVYGPTETTIWSTVDKIESGEALTIGRPLRNTRCYVLDPNFNPLPAQVPGQLFIAGQGLTRGYVRQPRTTALSFRPNPFAKTMGERLYRTGDLCKYREDGRLEYLSRADQLIKIRGYRVECGEIEAALSKNPRVAEAAVIATRDISGTYSLTAWLVKVGPAELTADCLREHLRESLPDYMIPTHFGFLDAMPRTPNKKLDRKALMAAPTPKVHKGPSRDWTDLEARLVALFEEILEQDHLDVTDHFFNCGGHSLLAIRLCNRIEERLGLSVDLPFLFAHPTAEELAQEFEKGQKKATSSAALPLNRGCDERDPLFFICGLFLYRQLAHALPADLPVYAVFVKSEVDALEGKKERSALPTLEEMAEGYVAEILKVQKDGTFRLAGISFGGLLAFEVARQLIALGKDVQFIGLLDTILPSAMHKDTLGWVSHQARRIIKDGPGFALRKLGSLFGLRKPSLPAPSDEAEKPDLNNEQQVQAFRGEIYRHATQHYEPQAIDCPMHLFRAIELELPTYMHLEAERGWSGLSKRNLEIIDIPGDHLAMLQPPHVDTLSRHMTRILNKLDAH